VTTKKPTKKEIAAVRAKVFADEKAASLARVKAAQDAYYLTPGLRVPRDNYHDLGDGYNDGEGEMYLGRFDS